MWSVVAFVSIVLATIILLVCVLRPSKIVASSVDGRSYNIAGGRQHADTLARMNRFLVDVLRHIRHKYVRGRAHPPWNPFDTHEEFLAFAERLVDRYNPSVLRENVPTSLENTSFVVRKGEEIAFCLNREDGRIHTEQNTLQFVALHELTHIGCLDYGHGIQFWKNFKFVIMAAGESGHHEVRDYSRNPETYCGLKIEYSPYFDDAM